MKYINRSITHVGNVRSANEDNMGDALTPNGRIFVVCDGMGGHVGGAQASSIAVNSIIEYFQKEVYDNVILALDRALNFANEQIYASALSNPELKGMGTTAVILLIREEDCFIAHVGDSRIYLRSDGKLNRLTKDHSFVQTLVDSGVIDDEDAENHPNKNQILQALGIAPTVNGTISQAPILPKSGDLFLLCSDGLNGMVTDKDLESIIQEENIEVSSENLVMAALNAGGNDNITASLILITESIHNSSKFSHFNPKPKVVDLTSTQQFGGGFEQHQKRKTKLPYLIGGLVALAAIATYFLITKDSEGFDRSKEIYTKADIEKAPCNNLNSLLNKKTNFHSDTITRSGCDENSYTIIISDSLVLKVIQIDDKGDGNSDQRNTELPKKEINKKDIQKPETDAAGKKDSIQKVTNPKANSTTTKTHKVKAGQNLSLIVQNYREFSPKLTVEELKEFNLKNNKKLTKMQKSKLERDELEVSMILLIPKI